MVYFSYPCCMFFQMTTFVANGILVTTMLQEFNFFHNITPFFTRLLATIRHLFDGHNLICFNISGLRKTIKKLLKSYQYSGDKMHFKWSVVTQVSTVPWSANEDKYLVTKCERKGTHLEVKAIGKETFGNKNLSNGTCEHGLNNAQIKLVQHSQIWSYRCTGIPVSANNPQIKFTKMYHLNILSDTNNPRSGK